MKNLNRNLIFSILVSIILTILNSCSSGSGEIVNKDGSKYIGHYLKNEGGEKIKDGEGILTYSDGKKYVGIWKKNELINGSFYAPNGELIYQGEWKGEAYNGKGQLYPKKGEFSGYKLDGHFLSGKANGFGILFKPDSTKEYEGYWKDFQYDGNGSLYINGKKTYEGGWKNGKMDGNGIVFSPDGQKDSEGEFRNSKMNGFGKKYKNGKLYYEGEFIDNKPNGTGIMYYENGKKEYEGKFKNGNPHGAGKSYKENGDKEYEGQFVNGSSTPSFSSNYNNSSNSNSSNSNKSYSQENSEKLSGFYQIVERYSMNPAKISGQNMYILFSKNDFIFMAFGSSCENAFSNDQRKQGHYSINGTSISVIWDDGKTASWTLSHVNGNITIGSDYQLILVTGI